MSNKPIGGGVSRLCLILLLALPARIHIPAAVRSGPVDSINGALAI
jgi:hypothetical protein